MQNCYNIIVLMTLFYMLYKQKFQVKKITRHKTMHVIGYVNKKPMTVENVEKFRMWWIKIIYNN